METLLSKLETIAKIIGGVSIPVIGLIVSIILHVNAEQNRKTQLYAEIMSNREHADSSIRASMFDTLMERYFGKLNLNRKSNNIDDLKNEVVLLNLLINNFQEYFNSRPLFEDLHHRLNDFNGDGEKEQLEKLKKEIIDISKSVAKKQEVMLERVGFTTSVHIAPGERLCLLLYKPEGMRMEGKSGKLVNMEQEYYGKCSTSLCMKPGSEKDNDENQGEERKHTEPKEKYEKVRNGNGEAEKAYYAIEITLHEILDYEVEVELTVYRDYYDENNVIFSRRELKGNIRFGVSYFDLPYMDNTRLFNGSRFALVLRNIIVEQEGLKKTAELGVISFREEFMSLRDRPFIEDMFNRLHSE